MEKIEQQVENPCTNNVLENLERLCYVCLESQKENLVKCTPRVYRQLNKMGLGIVKLSKRLNSLCTDCYNDINSSLCIFNRLQKASNFWEAILSKTDKLKEKAQTSNNRDNKNVADNEHKCLRCNEFFVTKTTLNNHIWSNHLRLKNDSSKCSICHKQYPNERNCRKHVFSYHEEERTHLCTICGKSGMNKAMLRLHCLSKHDGLGWSYVAKYTCDICKRINFQLKENYDQHMFEYHGIEKPVQETFIEDTVDVNFDEPIENDEDEWETHCELGQSNEAKPTEDLISDICIAEKILYKKDSNLEFDEEKNLLIHHKKTNESVEEPDRKRKMNADEQLQHINTGVENNRCPQCNEYFSRQFFYLHIWEHFRLPENPTTCKFCEKNLKTEESCRKHFLFKHFEKFQICDVCGKGDMTQLELFHHKRSKHPAVHKVEVESRKKQRAEKRYRGYKLMSLAELPIPGGDEGKSNEDTSKEEPFVIELTCPSCDKKFTGALQPTTIAHHKHIWEIHQRLTDAQQCPSCNKRFDEEFLTKKHYFFVHFEPYYSCDNCNKSGMTYKQLVDHLNYERKLMRAGMTIKSCEEKERIKTNKKKKSLVKYTEDDLKIERRVCAICNEKFFGTELTTKSAYLKHAWDAHGKASNPKRCESCNKTFDTEFYARRHFLHRHWDKTYKCEPCNLSNLTKMRLYQHRMIVHGSGDKLVKDLRPQLDCPYCCQKFKDPLKFEKHKQSHQDSAEQLKLICETCKKAYANIHSLKEHQLRAHIKVFSHHCRYCDKGFYSSGARNLHEITHHTKQYPFQCRFCGLQAAQKANLRRHIERMHDVKNDQQLSDSIIRVVSMKKRTKAEIQAQTIYIQHSTEESQ